MVVSFSNTNLLEKELGHWDPVFQMCHLKYLTHSLNVLELTLKVL